MWEKVIIIGQQGSYCKNKLFVKELKYPFITSEIYWYEKCEFYTFTSVIYTATHVCVLRYPYSVVRAAYCVILFSICPHWVVRSAFSI